MDLQVIKEHGDSIDSTTLAAMKYAEATVKEVLRYVSVVSATGRKVLKTFEVCGYTIPKVPTKLLCYTLRVLFVC